MKTLALFFALITTTATASDNWLSPNGVPVRDGQQQCVRNGFWTPATAHPDCAPDLKPKPVPQPAPAARVIPPPPAVAPAPPAPPPAPPAPVKVTLQTDTLFDFDRSVIKPEGRVRLADFARQLQTIRSDVVIVIGHTDSIGSDAYNMRLGQRRAEAVRAFLISQGVRQRIDASSRGEREPVADNKTAAGRAKNRRVVIEVVGTK